MAEYNGSIELIAGLKPKNNGDFPLVNAPDVLLPDGRRLSEIDFENLGGGTMAVTFSDENVGDDGVITATASHTVAEIAAVHDEGKYVYAEFNMGQAPIYIPLFMASVEGGIAVFAIAMGAEGIQIMVASDGATQIIMTSGDTEDSDVPPTSVDLSALDTTGEIVETYADGAVKTTTIEYDSTGNPVKITDGDGNVTEFTW